MSDYPLPHPVVELKPHRRKGLADQISRLEAHQAARRAYLRWHLATMEALIEREDLRIANLKAQLLS